MSIKTENMSKNNQQNKEAPQSAMKCKKLYPFMIALFFLLSLLFISQGTRKARSEYHSFQLNQVTKDGDKQTRTDYTDSEGRITMAADLGYATLIIYHTEQGDLEKYYDEHGNPIARYSGYYAVLREYDEQGRIARSTYLDSEDHPVRTYFGYATEKCGYNEKGQVAVTRYYDQDANPVCTARYGYGRLDEYDENGNNTRITYIDSEGNPMTTSMGYASVVRSCYNTGGPEKGKTEYEFYFDENGNPTALSMGQYGIHRVYNEKGQTSVLDYLDAEGNPIVTKKGYSTIVRTYHADNSIETERYFDREGNPYQLAEGQYGTKKLKNGQTVYLDQYGNEIFNFRTFLYNHSRIVIFLAAAVVIISGFLERKWNILLLAAVTAAVVYFTLLFRDAGETKTIRILESYRRFLFDREARSDIFKNIWLFVPMGAVLYQLYPRKRILLVPLILSIAIEGIQFITTTGYCEIDDIISNSIGGVIGFYAAKMIRTGRLHICSLKRQHSGQKRL